MRKVALLVGVVCLVGVAAWVWHSRGTGTTQRPMTGPPNPDVLRARIEEAMARGKRGPNDAVKAKLARFALPDPHAWFTQVYGDELGAELAATYPNDADVVAERLAEALHLKHCHERGYRVNALVYQSPTPSHPWLDDGVAAGPMVTPADLYAVSIGLDPAPDAALAAFYVSWFAHDQGEFYFIGKPGRTPPAMGKLTSAARDYDW